MRVAYMYCFSSNLLLMNVNGFFNLTLEANNQATRLLHQPYGLVAGEVGQTVPSVPFKNKIKCWSLNGQVPTL